MKRENYVTVEQAKALKRLGFDWECDGLYAKADEDSDEIELLPCRELDNYNRENWATIYCFSAPPLHLAAKWLREVKGIAINVIAHDNEWLRFKYSWNETYMQNCREKGKQWEEWSIVKHYGAHDTYEAALSEGITQILKLLEGKI